MNDKPNITGYEKLVSVIESLLQESKSKIGDPSTALRQAQCRQTG